MVCNKNCSGSVYSAIINVEQAQPLQDGTIDGSGSPTSFIADWSADILKPSKLGHYI
ncbi:MAG: hypothetical protein ABIL69_02935 [candidate division WOR-3 bacterium]